MANKRKDIHLHRVKAVLRLNVVSVCNAALNSSRYLGFVEVSLPKVKRRHVVVDFRRNFNTDVVLQY